MHQQRVWADHHRMRSVRQTSAFLAALCGGGTVKQACAAAGIERRAANERRKRDPAFAAEWDRAAQEGTDTIIDILEAELTRRAIEYSDTLLLAKLRALKPEVYRERNVVEHTTAIDFAGAREELQRRFERFAVSGEAKDPKPKPC